MLALGNRAHVVVPPEAREPLIRCFTDVFGCEPPVVLRAPGLAQPILAFRFPDGGSISFEFSSDAAGERRARDGAWLEVRSDDPSALEQKVLAAGLRRLSHPATRTFYFSLPGGLVLGIARDGGR